MTTTTSTDPAVTYYQVSNNGQLIDGLVSTDIQQALVTLNTATSQAAALGYDTSTLILVTYTSTRTITTDTTDPLAYVPTPPAEDETNITTTAIEEGS